MNVDRGQVVVAVKALHLGLQRHADVAFERTWLTRYCDMLFSIESPRTISVTMRA